MEVELLAYQVSVTGSVNGHARCALVPWEEWQKCEDDSEREAVATAALVKAHQAKMVKTEDGLPKKEEL